MILDSQPINLEEKDRAQYHTGTIIVYGKVKLDYRFRLRTFTIDGGGDAVPASQVPQISQPP